MAAAVSLNAWEKLCSDMKYSQSMFETGSEILSHLENLARNNDLAVDQEQQASSHLHLVAIAFLANCRTAETSSFSIASLSIQFNLSMRDVIHAIEELHAQLQPGVQLDELRSLKAVFVVDCLILRKWKDIFPQLFPAGLVGSDDDTSFELSWLLFTLAKAKLVGSRADVWLAWHILGAVAHFLLGHLPEQARQSDFWSNLDVSVPAECYPLPQEAQAALWTKLRVEAPNVAPQEEHLAAIMDNLKATLDLSEPTATNQTEVGGGGKGLRGFLKAETLKRTTETVQANYAELWPSCLPIDEQVFLKASLVSPRVHASPRAYQSPSRIRHDMERSDEQLLTPLRAPKLEMHSLPPNVTPFSYRFDPADWLKKASNVDCHAELRRFYEACSTAPAVEQNIAERISRMCDIVKRYFRECEVQRDSDELCELGSGLYYKTLLAFLETEERRLQQTDFSGLLSNSSLHTALFACCMECVSAAHMIDKMQFPMIIKLLGIHAFEFMKVIESFVKHEERLPPYLKHHFQQLEFRVLESFAWSEDSPLLPLLQEYDASRDTSQQGGQSRARAALQQFVKKFLYLAALRIRDMCVRLLLPDSVTRQVWGCVKLVQDSCRSLLINRHLDQIIMCSIYGVCKVNQRQIKFRDIVEQYKRQPNASASVFREVRMATREEEPGDIIEFYNRIFIPMMKDHLLTVTQSTTHGEESEMISQISTLTSPQRVTSRADVYLSRTRTLHMTPRTSQLYAFRDGPALSASEGLRSINQTLNGNSASPDSAAQTLQALSNSSSPISCVPRRQRRALNLDPCDSSGTGGTRSIIKRKFHEDQQST